MKKGDSQGQCKSCGEDLPIYSGRGPRRNFCIKSRCDKNSRFRLVSNKKSKERSGWTSTGSKTRKNIFRNNGDRNWFCQACSSEIPSDLPPYGIMDETDLFRLCSSCFFIAEEKGIKTIIELVNLIRSK